jgi:hypothetical protein
MYVEPDLADDFGQMDEFERELHEAMQRQPAPPSLKRKVMGRLWQRAQASHSRMVWWQRLAASVVLAVALGGALAWRNAEERRKGEEAKRQVFTALRITSRALNEMNAQMNERTRDSR